MIRIALVLALGATPAFAQTAQATSDPIVGIIVPNSGLADSSSDSQSPLTAWSVGLTPQMKAKTAHTDVAPMVSCDALAGKIGKAGEDIKIAPDASKCQEPAEAPAPVALDKAKKTK